MILEVFLAVYNGLSEDVCHEASLVTSCEGTRLENVILPSKERVYVILLDSLQCNTRFRQDMCLVRTCIVTGCILWRGPPYCR